MLILLDNVGKSFGAEVILRGVTANVNERDRIGIIGENGRGKTTLLNMLAGISENDEGRLEIDSNATIGYLRQLDGLNLTNTVYSEMQTVYSDVYKAIERCDEIDQKLSESADEKLFHERERLTDLINARDGYNADYHIRKMLFGMGFLEEEFTKIVGVLSGGERTRLNLAKLLLENPDILILDEPTNHLDFDTMAWLEDYLSTYKGAIIAVSHDRYFLDTFAKKIWEVEDNELTEYRGNYSAYEVLKEEKLKLQQKQYEANIEKAAKLQDYVDRNLVRASTTKMAQSRRNQLEKMEMTEKPKAPRVPLKFSFEFDTKPYEDILTVEGLQVDVGSKTLIHDLDLKLRHGDRLVIAGANGTGKTTLINTLTGRKKPAEGSIRFGEGAKTAVFDQHVTVSGPTPIDTIWALRPRWTQLEVRSYLARFGYRGEEVFKDSHALSGGERARLRFCEMSLDRANFLFLDEPTNHLDIYMRQAVTDALSRFEGTIVIVTHDRFLMKQLACPIMNIEGQLPVYYDDFDAFLAKHKSEGFKSRSAKKPKEKPDNSASPKNQKEARRQSAFNRQRVRECEREMEALQQRIDEYNLMMADPRVASDHERMRAVWKDLEDSQKKMDELLEEWATISESLEQ